MQVGGDGRSACYNPDPSLSVGSHPEWCTDFEPGYSEHVRKACPKTCKLCGQPAACVDASAAEVSAATKGTVPDCQAAKLLGVCAQLGPALCCAACSESRAEPARTAEPACDEPDALLFAGVSHNKLKVWHSRKHLTPLWQLACPVAVRKWQCQQ